ncbi:E3 ubiquitin-protein ligase UPL4-like isoform X3 [Histomonas meleagridis]|uniref:E3 ubiquitin-protein ligase UPL4-like isoform X3 n=1 Tax=Histomonas meleagridis TaxID=135588 RepID=UPI003559BC1E|nr:E3 ubiquitin-protein ligase UPL4-like isoform X3 [Histomonas meleagridis]KAH0797888.1 E3 ubiquitin-protein ligase UPL4-like isoform X3 [Histomonas meleagridis]
MFFSPLASDNAVKLLGRFIAKSIQMECLIDINFNPAIFKFIRGDNVDVWEVDEDLARALGRPEGLIGLPFNYPGLDFPLKPSDSDDSFDVTEENLDEFVSLIKEYTCGSKLDHLRNAFIEGFSEIFPFSYLDIFNENEICRIIRGDGPKFTYKDLEENVEISHGYERDSPQIAMLFETLSELEEDDQHLLIQFITGYYQLPIGGLAALDPKLTIAKRSFDDENTDPNTQLPSVMTCTNYFKVPSYTNKDIMREKILLAIHEGQDSFQLS